MMPVGVYPRTSQMNANMSAAKTGVKQTPEHIANRSASWLRYYREHPDAVKKRCNTPEVFALIQQYGHSLIERLRQKYYDFHYRCSDLNSPAYHRYGGRGIENRFTSNLDFFNYVINDLGITTFEQIEGLDIDRIDNDGHYEPGNIRFVTHKVNSNNRRNNKYVCK